MKKSFAKVAAFLLCAALGVSAMRGGMTGILTLTGTEALRERNETYLETSFQRALAGFGVMSAIKTGLAVIEGSTAGVSAGATVKLQVGDVVQAAYDYVDIAWRTLLLGCVSLLSMRVLLDSAELLGGWVLGITLILAGGLALFCGCAPKWGRTRQTLRDAFSVALVATFAVLYVLPLSVWGASGLSNQITRPVIDEAQAGFTETRDTLFPEDENVTEGAFSRIRQIPERIQKTADYLKTRFQQMAVWTIQLIAGYLFDCILFPLAVFLLLFWLTRSLLKYLCQRSFQCSLREDMGRILKG